MRSVMLVLASHPQIQDRPLPILFVAIHRTCPCPRRCAADLNRLSVEIAPIAKLVGLVDSDRAGALQEAIDSGLKFTMRSDSKGALLARLGTAYSLDLALVRPDGRILGQWPAFSRETLTGVLKALGTSASKIKIDVSSYPATAITGCKVRKL